MASKKYNLLSDVQRQILSKHYEEGMTGKGKAHLDTIKRASDEAGITIETVKVF